MSKITVVTTFHKEGMLKYGQRFLDSYAQQCNSQMFCYAENCSPVANAKHITILNQEAVLPKLVEFKNKWRNDPKANGTPPDDIKARRPRDWHKGFKWDAIRFANKVYAVFDAAQRCETRWLVWMDADMYVHSKFNETEMSQFLPKRAWMSYLGRGRKWPECGFYGIDVRSREGEFFLKEFERLYQDAENGIFKLEEWHDSYVFEVALKKTQEIFPKTPVYNISGNLVNGEGHPLINSGLGAYLDHLKGGRKDLGKSKQKDLIIKRNEEYWK